MRGAVEAANNAGGDETHTITFSVSPLPATFNLPNGPLSIDSNIKLIGQGQSQTFIDGRNISHTTQNQCFLVHQYKTLSVRELTVQYGYGVTTGGGAMYIDAGATVSMSNCRVVNNVAYAKGGAIYVNDYATLDVSVCDISGNQAGSAGGAVYNKGTVQIYTSTFTGNRVAYSVDVGPDGYAGGAIFLDGAGSCEIHYSTLEGNYSTQTANSVGGAIYNSSPYHTLEIDYSTFKYNSSINGGALYSKGVCDIAKSAFFENDAEVNGGAVYIDDGNELNAINCTFSANSANDYGGAIYDGASSDDAKVYLSYVTITDNHADYDEDGTGNGGGIFQQEAEINCVNTIIAGNHDESTGIFSFILPDYAGTLTSAGHNLIGVNQTGLFASLAGETAGNKTGTLNEPLDPRLDSLQNNGGLTYTHAPLIDSPAIDAGSNTDLFGTEIAEDQREVSRPINGKYNQVKSNDIGAHESSMINCDSNIVAVYEADGTTRLFTETTGDYALSELFDQYEPGTYVWKCWNGWVESAIDFDEEGYTHIVRGGYDCDRAEMIDTSYFNAIESYSRPSLTISAGTGPSNWKELS